MSAIAGMIDWRGGPAGPTVKKALAALALHGRDGEGLWDGGDVALGWRQTILHQEDHADCQPLTGGEGRFKLVFDGRLDNREELARLLSLAPEQASAYPDSAYVLAAYEKWGADCPSRLLGDFVFAVWDGDERELLVANDAMNVRPLVYFCGPHFFAFATHPAALFTHPEIPCAIEDITFVRHLMLRHMPAECTVFAGIKRIPGGNILRISAAGPRLAAYWRLEDTPDIRFKDDGDYVEAFRAHFTAAVRCRLRTIHPVGSHLSSGWDSSSVTSVAAGLLAEQGRRLRSYTAVPRRDWTPTYQAAGEIADEGPVAALVAARHANIDHVLIEGPGIWDFAALDKIGSSFAAPMGPCNNAGWIDLLHRTARADGVRVMLTAATGNLTISYNGNDRYAHLVRQGRLAELARELLAAHALGRSWRTLLNLSATTFLPPWLTAAVRAMFGRNRLRTAMDAMLAAAPQLEARRIARTEIGGTYFLRRNFLPRLGLRGSGGGVGHYSRAWDMDARDPAIDKRIVAFCFAIPDEQFLYRGRSRRLLRRAMAGIVPDEILNLKGRGRQAADWCEAAVRVRPALLEEIDRLAATSRLVDVLDMARMRDTIRSMNPATLAANPRVAIDYRNALTAVALGRFVRRSLEADAL